MERLKYPDHDGLIGIASRKGEWIQVFPKNIAGFQRDQARSSGRLDIRDLSAFDAEYLILFDDELNPFRAYRLKETSLHNTRLGRYLRPEAGT